MELRPTLAAYRVAEYLSHWINAKNIDPDLQVKAAIARVALLALVRKLRSKTPRWDLWTAIIERDPTLAAIKASPTLPISGRKASTTEVAADRPAALP